MSLVVQAASRNARTPGDKSCSSLDAESLEAIQAIADRMTHTGRTQPNGGWPRPGCPSPHTEGRAPDLTGTAFLAPAILAAALLLAPADSNFFWGMNGLRSLSPMAGGVVVVVSLATAAFAAVSTRNSIVRWGLAVAIAWTIAFPLGEKIHFLGDTQLRIRTLTMAGAGMIPLFGSWRAQLHANPLDIIVDILGVAALQGAGLSVIQAVSLVSWILAVLFLAGCWRLAGRLSPDAGARWGLTAALALSGTLVAFAGYAESAGLVAVTTVWWWAEALAPLSTGAQAWRIAAAFVALSLAHRVGIVMAAPLVWRALGPPLDRDQPSARQTLLLLGVAAIAALAVVTATSRAGSQLWVDIRDLVISARTGLAQPSDIVNALVLVSPLALVAPFVAGRRAAAAWLRSPEAAGLLIVAVPLVIVLQVIYPVVSYTMGPEREWEANLLPGITLTVVGAAIVSRLHRTQRRIALMVLLPALGLCAASWLAVNADPAVATRRAFAMAERPSTLTDLQRGNLHAYLGQRAMDVGQANVGGREFEQAFDIGGNARRALQASEAWLVAGDLVAARRALTKARTRGPLGAELETSAGRIEAMFARAAADTLRDAAQPSSRVRGR